MTVYHGLIKSKAEAERLAVRLDATRNPRLMDAAKILRKDWRHVAELPQLAERIYKELSQCTA